MRLGTRKRVQRNSSLPKASNELVHAIEAETVLSGVTDIHRHMLRMELVLQSKKSITYPNDIKKEMMRTRKSPRRVKPVRPTTLL